MLQAGDTAEAAFITTDRDMASSLSVSEEDSFPDVFATSRMIALMELAGARLMKRILDLSNSQLALVFASSIWRQLRMTLRLVRSPRFWRWKGNCSSLGLKHSTPQERLAKANTREQSSTAIV